MAIVKEGPVKLAYLKDLKQTLWDTEVVPAAGATPQLIYFTAPQGQPDSVAVRKTRFETNMTTSGLLPKPQYFDLHGIRVKLYNQAAFAPPTWVDITECLWQAVLTFTIGDNRIIELPLDEFPQGVGHAGLEALDAQAAPLERTALTRGAPSVFEILDITIKGIPKRISHGETFQARIEWTGALAPTPVVNTSIRVSLVGILYKGIG